MEKVPMKGSPVVPPIYMTATYQFETTDDLIQVVEQRAGFLYSRWDNPSVMEIEARIAAMEGYESAFGFSSGMAAISTSVLAHVRSGSRIVGIREIYGGTFELFKDVLPGLGVEVVLVNCWDSETILDEIRKGLTLLYIESPTNPLLRVIDVAPLAEAAHRQGAVVVQDATFGSVVNQHPADWGVDIVVHSGTKFIGGHHDITAGFACCNQPYAAGIWNLRKVLGGVMDPMTAFLALRGIQTLPLRVKQQDMSAMQIASFLEGHDRVSAVHYPGLTSHPDHAVAASRLKGYGSVLSFEVCGGFEEAVRVMDRLKNIKLATSLGGVTSLANQPVTNTHAALDPSSRKRAGISESLIRLSVGIEPVDTLIRDLSRALEG